ncbi:MAG: apolipoprotein N-acyltransferase [Opitutaceae bacterium]
MNHKSPFWGILAALLTAVLWVLSMPPFDFAEAAYIAFVPILLWLYTSPSKKWVLTVGFVTAWVSWFVILIWLRHVTWFGTFALSAVLAAMFLTWWIFVSWVLAAVADRGFLVRVTSFLSIAGAWVVLEWVRTWLFWGFPWAPLSLSQWERPVVLQIAAWSGAYGVSFMLVFFNCCIAQTLRNRALQRKARMVWAGWFSPDLYLAMGALGLCVSVFFNSLPQRNSAEAMFTAAVVQPYLTPEVKWETERELENVEILEAHTRFVAELESDVILWPEAATPWPVVGYPDMAVRVERLGNEIGKPILMGNLAWDRETDLWYNGAFIFVPGEGVRSDFYVKRELVPFGEYVPAPFGFIKKVVPVGGSFVPGEDPKLIDLPIGEKVFSVGSLVCYEDIFPSLARDSARAGAEVFFVATNNAWYGEEGGAPQHAAHSVLRAVENRRPVMRAGNAGWSGWIDAYGTVREVLTDADGSIYFRGGGAYDVFQFQEWRTQQSFYTRHGDWFVWVSGALLVLGILIRKIAGARPSVPLQEDA